MASMTSSISACSGIAETQVVRTTEQDGLPNELHFSEECAAYNGGAVAPPIHRDYRGFDKKPGFQMSTKKTGRKTISLTKPRPAVIVIRAPDGSEQARFGDLVLPTQWSPFRVSYSLDTQWPHLAILVQNAGDDGKRSGKAIRCTVFADCIVEGKSQSNEQLEDLRMVAGSQVPESLVMDQADVKKAYDDMHLWVTSVTIDSRRQPRVVSEGGTDMIADPPITQSTEAIPPLPQYSRVSFSNITNDEKETIRRAMMDPEEREKLTIRDKVVGALSWPNYELNIYS